MTSYPLTDRYQRPLIKLPGAKKEEPFTRVTTVAKTLDGQEALSEWKARMVAQGACLRKDILAQFEANLPINDDNKALMNGYVEALKESAASTAGANLGDALHIMTARVDRGEKFKPLPPHDVSIKAYQECLSRHGVQIIPGFVERTVVLPDLKIAGSFDRIVEKHERKFIFDLKTAQRLDYSWPSIAIQLALYSRARWLYNWDDQSVTDMPEVDQKIGLVLWLPAGKAEASLHVVDLEAGWEATQHALWARSWRARKDLAREARAS